MTILSIVQDVCSGVGLPLPGSAVGSQDDNVRRIVRFVEQEGRDLVKGQFAWQVLKKEHIFPAVNQEIQTNGIPADFQYFIPHTFFNRTRKREVVGPMTDDEWQVQASLTATTVIDAFKISGNQMRFIPHPVTDDQMVYDYVSKNWVDTNGDGMGDTDRFSADTESPVFDEEMMTLAGIWRYNSAKGLDYEEDFRNYQVLKARLKGDDGGTRIVDLGGNAVRRRPIQPRVQEGSWPLA